MGTLKGQFLRLIVDRKRVAGLFVASVAFFAPLQPVLAARQPYEAVEMIRSTKRLQLSAGESASFTVGFKNNGGATWSSEGKNYVSVYTYDPKYRKSLFADQSWGSGIQPTRVKEAKVAPGTIGTFMFTFFAPLETGTYHETFQLAVENAAWIPGGKFTVEIEVTPKLASDGKPSKAVGYKAAMMLVSDRHLTVDAGKAKEFRVAFKNTGRKSWTKSGDTAISLKLASGMPPFFQHASWTNGVAAGLPSDEVKPGQLAFFNFTLSAPVLGGQYVPKFNLAVGGEMMEGGQLDIPMEVKNGTVSAALPPASTPAISADGPRGPNLRIGLYYANKPFVVTAPGPYTLFDYEGNKVRELSGVTTTTFDPASKSYQVVNGSFTFTGKKYVRFTPNDPATTIFEILSLENRPTWDPTINFNRYRGSLEYYYIPATDHLWVTEEVPVEDYMRGMAETSNGSPYEFQKALIVAARTYALYVHGVGGKHVSEFFDLNTTGNDQVYKGYASELVRPNVVRAVEETRGTVVTYNNELVVTPYFSRSDGRTRSWTEVWGGSSHPWLVSKATPNDQGQTLWGHGVGMSASDAVGRAADGATFTDLLQYYYTGTQLQRFY